MKRTLHQYVAVEHPSSRIEYIAPRLFLNAGPAMIDEYRQHHDEDRTGRYS